MICRILGTTSPLLVLVRCDLFPFGPLCQVNECGIDVGTIDCSYHVMWITLAQALSDYGIQEVNAAVDTLRAATADDKDASPITMPLKEIPSEVSHMVGVEKEIATEAFKSSTRIAGLVRRLTPFTSFLS